MPARAIDVPAETDVSRQPFDVIHSGTSGKPDLSGFGDRWTEAFETDRQAGIHQHPELVIDRPGDDEGRPWILARRNDDRIEWLAACVPKAMPLAPIPGLGPLVRLDASRLVSNRLLGSNDPAALDAFFEGVAGALLDRRTDGIYLEDVEVDSALWRGAQRIDGRRGIRVLAPTQPQRHWWIRFPAVREDYWSAFSAKTRSTFRRKAKRFEHRVRRITRPDEVPAFVEQAHLVSRSSWQTRRVGLRVSDDETTRRQFLLLAGKGALRSYVLEHDSHPVAFVVGSQWNGCYAYEEVAYRPEYASFSPGTILLYEALKDMTRDGCPDVLDFGTGDAEYKRIFGNDETYSGPLVLVGPGGGRATALRLVRLRNALASRGLAALTRLGLHRSLRRWYRRGS